MYKIFRASKIKDFYKKILLVLFLLFCLFLAINTNAQETFNFAGLTEGEGTHFEITDSGYLNIILDSSESIKLTMESVPKTIKMFIQPNLSALSTFLTVKGLEPNTTYFKYEDDYHNLKIINTDEYGAYSYIQDISTPHIIFIQPKASTKFIRDNSNGGDCYLIGNWDNLTKTCTLTEDINETIQIDNDNIILNGNNHTIAGSFTGSGIYLYARSNIVIENLKIKNFTDGISIFWGGNNLVENNVIFYNYVGLNPRSTDNNIVRKNTISNNTFGIWLGWYLFPYPSLSNQFYNNNFIDNNISDFVVAPAIGTIFYFPPQIGGNYWSKYDTPEEGCDDLNNDNFCDSPYNFYTENTDNYPWTKQDGWLNQPPTISGLNQYKPDEQTEISEGGITAEDIVVFKATLSDPNNDQIKLQIELKEFNQSFDGMDIIESDFVNSGSEIAVTKSDLSDGNYKWRARAVDSQGATSDWQEFGEIGNIDFIVVPLSQAAADLAKIVVNGPYLGDGDTFGGKGWDPVQAEYVTANLILSGYNFWNNKLRLIDFGAGVDCSGLVQWSFNRSFNPKKSLLRNVIRWDGADGQYRHNSETITEENLRPGDLLFLDKDGDSRKDHVGMYVGDNGTFDVVEAFSPRRGIIGSTKTEFKTRVGFIGSQDFRHVVLTPSIGGQVKASSPIDLIMIDPDGLTITPTTSIQTDEEYLREIPSELYYTESVLGVDGRPEDIVYWPKQKTGDYIIEVLPEAGISQTETYSVEFTVGEQTVVLADNIPLNQIPSNGYGIVVSTTGTLSTFIPVSIDIKPNSYPNSINLDSNGVVPVAIFGSATFDVKQIDPVTVKLANATVKLKGNSQSMVSYSDINWDAFTDVVVQISTQALQLTSSDVKANLEGQLMGGAIIKGSDSIRIVP